MPTIAPVIPMPVAQFFDDSGKPLAGGLLFSYLAGSSTPQPTYADAALTTPNANPVVLSASGRAVVYLAAVNYKFDLQNSAGVSMSGYPRDNIGDFAQLLTANLTTAGVIPYFNGTTLAQDAKLNWDATNHRLLIGTAVSPAIASVAVVGVGSSGVVTDAVGGAALLVSDSGGAPGNGGEIRFGFEYLTSQSYFAAIKGSAVDGTGNTLGDLVFYTRTLQADVILTERMRIKTGLGNTPAGAVSIGGVTAPVALLHVGLSTDVAPPGGPPNPLRILGSALTASAAGDNVVSVAYGNQSAATTFSIQGVEGFVHATHAAGTVALMIGAVGSAEHDGAGTVTNMRGFESNVTIRSSGGGSNAAAIFANVAGQVGAGSGVFTNGYGLFIGTFGSGFTNKFSIFSQDTGATMDTAGPVRMRAFGAGTATFDASGNVSSVSDARLKRLIRPFGRGLEAIRGLAPVLYAYAPESGLDQGKTDYVGFLAQDVARVIPEAVASHPDKDVLGLNDRGILAALVNALQACDARLSYLEREVA